jgi:hypothetical protein
MSKPREAEVALETPEFIAWKNSGKATRESTPLHIKTYEKVLMIEKSAYDELKAELDHVSRNYADAISCTDFAAATFRAERAEAKLKIAVEALENIKLKAEKEVLPGTPLSNDISYTAKNALFSIQDHEAGASEEK